MKTGFFAYSGKPYSVGESIEEAIELVNSSGIASLKSWKSYTVNGKLVVIDKVTKAIDEAEYFCADLTGFSDNVIFELGYAIAKNKAIFLILDSSHIESTKRYKEFSSLTTLDYQKYINSSDIRQAFISFVSDSTAQTKLPKKQISGFSNPLMFLKSQVDTPYSRVIASKIAEYKIPCYTDDASENTVQPIEWYLERLNKATLIEFSSTERVGYQLQNSKCSLVAGLALGYGLDILMVAEEPYEVPIDYRDLLIKYRTKKRCEQIINEFLSARQERLLEYYSQQNISQKIQRQLTEFQQITFGEFLAEDESEDLSDYYVETFAPSTLIKKASNIVIGRKGTGKTATLYYLKNILEKDSRNHVCLIKPINFEIDALLKILQVPSEEYEKSYLVESAWKLLIYTEVAKSIYDKITSKPLSALNPAEIQFKDFIESKPDLFLKDFSERLEQELENIRQANIINGKQKFSDFKIKLAEIMHGETLAQIRNLLAELFKKDNKILVLIDNLDKSWKKDNKLNLQSEWILGLLSVTGRIVRELLSFTIKGQSKNIDFHLTIFLRSDIFKYILGGAREPDKVEYTNLLNLGDQDILFRIIEQRFIKLSSNELLSDNLWEKYIVKTVEDIPVKDYIYEKLIPRPRDIIYFFKSAHEYAVSRGHSLIEEEDIKSGYENYSSWVFTSMMVENGITIDQLKEFLYQLVGCPQVIDKETLYVAMCDAQLSESEERLDYLIEHLSTLSILGKEVSKNKFQFEYAFDSKDVINAKSRKLNSERYKIHNALVPYLALESKF
jgi:Cdc6-like AAA superfamily ATPase